MLRYEWQRDRVRIASSFYAAWRYSWLRPADPAHVRFLSPDATELVHLTLGRHGGVRQRALRVDEAWGLLDAQLAIDDVHSIDRRKLFMLRYAYDCERRALTRGVSKGACELRLVATRQRVGERCWWVCPSCGRRCRFLYHFRVGRSGGDEDALGCRVCLGLTYPSRARHGCQDQDRVQAARGDPAAAERQRRRDERAAKKAEHERRKLEAFRSGWRQRISAVAQTQGYRLPWDH